MEDEGSNLKAMNQAKRVLNAQKVRPATFSPYVHGGVLSVDELAEMVKELKASGAEKVKLTGEIVFVWDGGHLPDGVKENGKWAANDFKAASVRPVKICSAQTFCQRFQQPVLPLAKEIDVRFKGILLPMKLVIGIAGCQRSCSEPSTKDIGIIGTPKGYAILAGGSAGMHPMIARRLGTVPTQEGVLELIARIITFVRESGKNTRLGGLIEKVGLEEFKEKAGIKELFIGNSEGAQ